MSVDSPPVVEAISIQQSKRAERLLLPAAFITNAGSAFQITAASILVFRAGQTTLSVGWLFIAVAIPQVALSVMFGRLVDRVDRRMLSVVADLVSAATAFALPIWLWTHGSVTMGSYLANFLLACSTVLFVPASSALVKERIRDDRLAYYNSRFEMAMNAAMLLASSLSGFLIIEFGSTVLFIFNSATFIVSAVLTAMVGRKQVPPDASTAAEDHHDTESDHGASTTARKATLQHPPIRRLGFLYSSGMINLMVTNVILTALILKTFHAGAWLVGVVDALAGAGFILGAACYAWISARISGLQLAVLCSLLCSITIIIEPLHYIGLMLIHPIGAFCFANFRIAARTLLMQASPMDRVGRIFGATQAFGLAIGATATLSLSILADRTSVPVAFWGLAALIGGIAIANYVGLVKPLSNAADQYEGRHRGGLRSGSYVVAVQPRRVLAKPALRARAWAARVPEPAEYVQSAKTTVLVPVADGETS